MKIRCGEYRRKNLLFSPKPIYALERPCYNVLANHSEAAKHPAISVLACLTPRFPRDLCTPLYPMRINGTPTPGYRYLSFPNFLLYRGVWRVSDLYASLTK